MQTRCSLAVRIWFKTVNITQGRIVELQWGLPNGRHKVWIPHRGSTVFGLCHIRSSKWTRLAVVVLCPFASFHCLPTFINIIVMFLHRVCLHHFAWSTMSIKFLALLTYMYQNCIWVNTKALVRSELKPGDIYLIFIKDTFIFRGCFCQLCYWFWLPCCSNKSCCFSTFMLFCKHFYSFLFILPSLITQQQEIPLKCNTICQELRAQIAAGSPVWRSSFYKGFVPSQAREKVEVNF